MKYNFVYNNVNDALPALARELLVNGDEFGSRAGTTKELMHVGISLDRPWQREIVLPGRKANLAAQIAETMWVLAGRNDVAWLSHYLPRAVDFSDDGVAWRAGYGPRLRDYHGAHQQLEGGVVVDQLAYLVDTMERSPGSRQAVATLWDPTVDTRYGKDIACNNWLNLSSRKGYLDLHVAVRSNDLIWGWSGINAFEWSALLEIVAGLSGLMVGGLHFSTTSLHLYDRHWAKARQLGEQGENYSHTDSPRFDARVVPGLTEFDLLVRDWFELEGQIRTGRPMYHEVNAFPEPMMRSWLRVLQWYWGGDERFLEFLRGTRLHQAALVGVAPAGEPQPAHRPSVPEGYAVQPDGSMVPPRPQPERPSFLDYVNALHHEKHAAYGDSWKRRGEPGILGNIARKVDRLESGKDTSDETQLDTAIDLLIYLAKYRAWLTGAEGGPADVEALLVSFRDSFSGSVKHLVEDYDFLLTLTERSQKINLVDTMLGVALGLAQSRY